MAAPHDVVGAGRASSRGVGELDRVDAGVDDEVRGGRDFARLFEETEREASGDAKAGVYVAARVRASCDRRPPGRTSG
jgi:hypothetical protein